MKKVNYHFKAITEHPTCEHCGARKPPNEKSGSCCNNGTVKIELPPPNPLLKALHTGKHPKSKHFKKNIRQYNNSLAMASMGGLGDKLIPKEKGFQPTVKFQGRIYHALGDLIKGEEEQARYAQLFTFDGTMEEEAEARMKTQGENSNLFKALMIELQEMLKKVNPYVKDIKTICDIPDDQIKDVKLVLRQDKAKRGHKGQFNLPSTNEVAIISLNDALDFFDVKVFLKDGGVKFISEKSPHADPLHFVLLFPEGSHGWTEGLLQTNGQKLTLQLFYKYLLQCRDEDENHFNTILRSGRLMQEYACSAFYKIERDRLNYVEKDAFQKNRVKVASRQNIIDAMKANEDTGVIDNGIGKHIVLPASHVGSPRWYQKRFNDAMCVVREYGKPDYFITFTAFGKWEENIRALHDFGTTEDTVDRPDVTNRHFKQKLDKLHDDIWKENCFGRATAMCYTIEWQKRGLPHCHMMVWVRPEDKPKTAADYDGITVAEIPNPEKFPVLHELVTKLQIHGPCQPFVNKGPACLDEKGKCTKEYPKPLRKESYHAEESYPVYRRRHTKDGGFTAKVQCKYLKTIFGFANTEVTVDNSVVVPYNPMLLYRYRSHINVEIVASISGLKYLFKYIHKGSDRVVIEAKTGQKVKNEVDNYINGRYLSGTEADWNIRGFGISHIYPPVETLTYHLPGEQQVIFDLKSDLEKKVEKSAKTMLTEFFRLNATDEYANQFLYTEILKYYRWDDSSKKFVKRKNRLSRDPDSTVMSDMIGRLAFVPLNNFTKERFYLRMLLHNVRGPTCFDDLKMVDGILCETFHEACVKRGLVEGDKHIEDSLEEAFKIRFGSTFRHFFVTIIVYGNAENPKKLYEDFKEKLCEDLTKKKYGLEEPTDFIINECLLELQAMFADQGKDMVKDFKLPQPKAMKETDKIPKEILEETNYDQEKLKDDARKSYIFMNDDQKAVFDAVIDSVNRQVGRLFAIDAPGGTGKTFVLHALLAKVRSEGKIALAMATTGIASTLLPNGRTIHTKLKLPIKLHDKSEIPYQDNSTFCQLMQRTKLMIIDEVTMGNKNWFHCVDRTLRKIRNCDEPFGGITVVFSGDFRQCLPIVHKGGKADILDACLKNSYLWLKTTVFNLKTNMRLKQGTNPKIVSFARYDYIYLYLVNVIS